MSIMTIIEGIEPLASNLWKARIPPHEVQTFGTPFDTRGEVSVVSVVNAEQHGNSGLKFSPSEARTLNLGTSSEVLIINVGQSDLNPSSGDLNELDDVGYSLGSGDQEFLRLCKELPIDACEAAEKLLNMIRAEWPGDLQKGGRNNFKNKPDNFWYVIVQPRKGNLSITVRGTEDRFSPSSFDLRPDRPGYTRFFLENLQQVPEAFRIISNSKRKTR